MEKRQEGLAVLFRRIRIPVWILVILIAVNVTGLVYGATFFGQTNIDITPKEPVVGNIETNIKLDVIKGETETDGIQKSGGTFQLFTTCNVIVTQNTNATSYEFTSLNIDIKVEGGGTTSTKSVNGLTNDASVSFTNLPTGTYTVKYIFTYAVKPDAAKSVRLSYKWEAIPV